MANPVVINPTLTLAGQAAAFNASNNGLELKITHVSFGKAHYDPTGNEVALVDPVGSRVTVAGASRPTPYQIRMVSQWREDVGEVGIGEIGFWAEDVLVFVWSKADGTVASYKTDGVSYVLFNDLAFAQVPAGSVSFVVDPDESVALAALLAHEGADNAHPQYVLRAKFPDYQGHLWGEVGGTADAITLTLPEIVELVSYIKGNRFTFKAAQTNTGATTINVDGVGAVEVLKTGGLPLTAGSIIAGGVYDVYYDGSKFQLTAGAGFASAEATDLELQQTTSDSTSWVSVRRAIKALSRFATLASPTFTGDPKAPTPATTDNDTSLATTEWVRKVLARYGLAANQAYVWTGNIDQINETGCYTSTNGTTGTKPVHPTTGAELIAGVILHVEREATCAFQIWESLSSGFGSPTSGLTFKRSRLSGGVWTGWGMMWDATNTPKMANATDQTAGKMVTVGSFGLGGSIRSTENDLNKYTVPGEYTTISSPITNLPAGWPTTIRYNLTVKGRIDALEVSPLVQILTMAHVGSPTVKTAMRTYTAFAGAWSDWVVLTHTDSPIFTGVPTAPTPALLDNGKTLATTEFVKKNGLSLSRFNAYTVSTTLAATVVGSAVEFYGTTAGQTLTLPLSSDVRTADAILLFNWGPVPVTIARQGADQIGYGASSGMTSMVMQPGDNMILIAGSNLWFIVGGTAANQYSGGFAASLAGLNGYQKLPSGLIEQWGWINAAPNSTTTITLPIAFPNAFKSVFPAVQDNIAYVESNPIATALPLNAGSFSLRSYYAASNIGVAWRAIGY